MVDIPNKPVNGSFQNDPLFLQLQSFYQQISEIPKEVLIVGSSNPVFKNHIYPTFMAKLKSGKNYTKLGENADSVMERIVHLDKRMRNLDCNRLVKKFLVKI